MARDYTKPNSIRTATEKAYSDIDIFFTRHPVTNDIVVKEDTDAIKRSLRNIILTNNFERPFKPNFGTNITRLLFELNTKEIGTRPLDKIAKKIIQLEPRVSDVKVGIQSDHSRPNDLEVTIFYSIVNGLKQQSVNFTVSRVR